MNRSKHLRLILMIVIGISAAGCGLLVKPDEQQSGAQVATPVPELPVTTTPWSLLRLSTPDPRPTPVETLEVETAPYPEPTRTALPDRGVRVGRVSEITISHPEIEAGQIFNFDLDGNLLATRVTIDEKRSIVVLDLETGRVRQVGHVATAIPGGEGPLISGRYVAWSEPAPDLGDYMYRLQVADLETNDQFTVASGSFRRIDFKDGLVVWEESRREGWGIYGYDVENNQPFTVVEDSSFQTLPRICSSEWSIYLRNVQEGELGEADLHAHHLATDEDIFIGRLPFPLNAMAGRQHACDGHRVAWVSVQREERTRQVWNSYTGQYRTMTGTGLVYKQHLYDLETRTDRILEMPVLGFPSRVILDNDILISSVGYDLEREAPFDIIPSDLPFAQKIGGPIYFSGNRVIWPNTPERQPRRLLTTLVSRD